MLLAKTLSFYKRLDIRNEMVGQAANKEIAVRFGDRGFGKRPDVLKYSQDILDFAQRKATSFHCSEELWENPLLLTTDMKKSDADSKRTGWDLILDIDCPVWEFSKLLTHLFVKALKDHDVKAITCKFSGNKGFHIAVPWEAFPESVADKRTSELFPEAPKRIANYLIDFISSRYISITPQNTLLIDSNEFSLDQLKSLFSKESSEFIIKRCQRCKKKISTAEAQQIYDFHCRNGHYSAKSSEEIMTCPKCGSIMDKYEISEPLCSCGENAEITSRFDPLSIIKVDTILISPRHLYRMPYSFHEKSMLVSVSVAHEKILSFDKRMAEPENVKLSIPFLDRKIAVKGEASRLLSAAYDYAPQIESDEKIRFDKELEIPEEAIPESCFPQCILKGLQGLNDGRKRFLFVLTNFLYSCGWGPNDIDVRVREWNSKNHEPLKETVMVGHLRHARMQKKKVLPPNCSAEGYYKDLGLCAGDICRMKNPVQYAKKCFNASKNGRKKKPATANSGKPAVKKRKKLGAQPIQQKQTIEMRSDEI